MAIDSEACLDFRVPGQTLRRQRDLVGAQPLAGGFEFANGGGFGVDDAVLLLQVLFVLDLQFRHDLRDRGWLLLIICRGRPQRRKLAVDRLQVALGDGQFGLHVFLVGRDRRQLLLPLLLQQRLHLLRVLLLALQHVLQFRKGQFQFFAFRGFGMQLFLQVTTTTSRILDCRG